MRTMHDEMEQQTTPKKAGDALARLNPGIVVGLAALVFTVSLAGFYYVGAPSFLDTSLHFAWAVTSSLTITVAVILFFPTLARRRKQNAEFSPPELGGIWWDAKERLNVITPLVFALVAPVAGFGFRLELSIESPGWLPTLALWIVTFVAMVSLLDVHSIATKGAEQFSLTTWEGVKRVNRLRSHLDNYLSVLAAQIAAWVLLFAVVVEDTIFVLAEGGFLTGLLALIYLPTALAVDRLASTMVEARTKNLDWETDFLASRQLRDAYRRELGLDQTLRERFEKGFYVGAPLATALFSSFVNVG